VDGVDVVDGALTNPFAHAVVTALHVAGARDLPDVADVDVELYRANPIEADDTSCARIVTADGVPVTVAVTLCADQEGTDEPPPYVVVHGTEGTARLSYTDDSLEVRARGRRTVTRHGRQDLLVDLVEHIRDPGRPLLAPVATTRAFTRVLDAVRTAPDPLALPPDAIDVVGEGPQQRRMVRGIREAVARSADELLMFSELALPWAAGTRR
jgi:predicted dehydrogenase